jgi:hypothetical protein
MRYRLRTLLIVLALGPMLLAGAWFARESLCVSARRERIAALQAEIDRREARLQRLIGELAELQTAFPTETRQEQSP